MDSIDRTVNSPPGRLKDRQTAIRDALFYAGNLLNPPQTGDSVVLASDGFDNHSKISIRALELAYRTKEIRFFVFEPPPEHPSEFLAPLEQASKDNLLDLAALTGGAVVLIPDADGPRMFVATHNIEDQIANYYLVELNPSQEIRKLTELKLELVDSSRNLRKDVELAFPHKLLPCSVLAQE
jgi:hypothetical protein